MLTGEKVTLREVRESDFDRLTAVQNDFEIWMLADNDPLVREPASRSKPNSRNGSRRGP